jgi:hypothetical protein
MRCVPAMAARHDLGHGSKTVSHVYIAFRSLLVVMLCIASSASVSDADLESGNFYYPACKEFLAGPARTSYLLPICCMFEREKVRREK